jgi:hypothetical protein
MHSTQKKPEALHNKGITDLESINAVFIAPQVTALTTTTQLYHRRRHNHYHQH